MRVFRVALLFSFTSMCSITLSQANLLQTALSILKTKLVNLSGMLKKEKLPKLDLTQEEIDNFVDKDVIEFIKEKVKEGYSFEDFLPYRKYVFFDKNNKVKFETTDNHSSYRQARYQFLKYAYEALPAAQVHIDVLTNLLKKLKDLNKEDENYKDAMRDVGFLRMYVIRTKNKDDSGSKLQNILNKLKNTDIAMLGLAVATGGDLERGKLQQFPKFLEEQATKSSKSHITIILVDGDFLEKKEIPGGLNQDTGTFKKKAWKIKKNGIEPFKWYVQKNVDVIIIPFYLAPYIIPRAGWNAHHLPGDPIAVALADYLKTIYDNGKSVMITDGFHPPKYNPTAEESISKAFIDYMLADWWASALKKKRAWVYLPTYENNENIPVISKHENGFFLFTGAKKK